MSILLRSVMGAVLIGVPMMASADDLPQGFSGKGQAGYVMSRGNSDTDAANAKIDLFLLTPQWKHAFTLEGLYGKSAEVTSAERWDLRLQSDYTINTKLFAFGALSGLLAQWGPLSGWAALAFPLVLPPLGIGLARLFC